MIAKIIVHAATRAEAARKLAAACARGRGLAGKDQRRLPGPRAAHPDFVARPGRYRLHRRAPATLMPPAEPSRRRAGDRRPRTGLPSSPAARPGLPAERRAAHRGPAGDAARPGLSRCRLDRIGPCCRCPRRTARSSCSRTASPTCSATPPSNAPDAEAAAGTGAVTSPMPGRMVASPSRSATRSPKGCPWSSLEAMKMEHALHAPFDGTVAEIAARVGQQVTEGWT